MATNTERSSSMIAMSGAVSVIEGIETMVWLPSVLVYPPLVSGLEISGAKVNKFGRESARVVHGCYHIDRFRR
jgi:hypothetical protein